jgi:hypothetical protein
MLDREICKKCRFESGLIKVLFPPRQWGCPARWKKDIGGGELRITSNPPKGCHYSFEQGIFSAVGNKE